MEREREVPGGRALDRGEREATQEGRTAHSPRRRRSGPRRPLTSSRSNRAAAPFLLGGEWDETRRDAAAVLRFPPSIPRLLAPTPAPLPPRAPLRSVRSSIATPPRWVAALLHRIGQQAYQAEREREVSGELAADRGEREARRGAASQGIVGLAVDALAPVPLTPRRSVPRRMGQDCDGSPNHIVGEEDEKMVNVTYQDCDVIKFLSGYATETCVI
ncbi:hypothetical protein U9M48_029076 [Paspalum notatum var. saurae]|uniref:Uncharacterized protein n=1 Tax=Paspalum notatum var. saurae TaxID=547442 RepID=A0AAQ3TWS0_PASNO